MPAKENRMGTQPVGRLLFSMAVPLALSMLIQALYNVVDSIFVARISEAALTAVSLASPMNMLIISFGVGTAVGVNSLIARRLGARRYDEANAAAVNGLFVTLLTAIAFLVFGFVGAGPFIRAYTSDAAIAEMGTSYLRICCVFGVGVFMAMCGERIMQAQGKPVYSMLMQLVGAVTNLILDPILIFGLFGLPALGVRGAAIATVIGQWASMALAFIIIGSRKNDLRITFKGFRPSAGIIRDIYAVGAPSIIMQGIGTVLTICLNAILISFSATAVAVFGAYFKVQSFAMMPMIGMMNAAMSIEAYNYGARNRKRLMHTWRLSLWTGVALMLLCTGLIWLFARDIMTLFNASETMAHMGVAALRTMSSCLPIAAASISASIVFQAVGRGVYSMVISLLRQIFMLIPAAWILARVVGEVNAVWFSFPVAEGVSFLVSAAFMLAAYRRYIRPLDAPVTALT